MGYPGMVVGTDNEAGKPWDDAAKSALVAQIVSGKLSVKAACQRHQLSPETIQEWVRVFRRTALRALDEHLRQAFLMQGADAASLSTAEYTGTLDDISIPDLLQTFQMGAKDGVITISHEGQRSQLWCLKGEVIDAESGRLRGAAAVYRIVNIESGQVLADFRSEPRERRVELPGHALLLEAARRKDECAHLAERLGGVSSVYAASAAALARLDGSPASAAERDVLALCDGRRTLRQLLDQSELGDLETLTALSSLAERQLVVRDPTSRRPPRSSRSWAPRDTPGGVNSLLPHATSQRAAPGRGRRTRLTFVGIGLGVGMLFWAMVVVFSDLGGLTALRPAREASRGRDVSGTASAASAPALASGAGASAARSARTGSPGLNGAGAGEPGSPPADSAALSSHTVPGAAVGSVPGSDVASLRAGAGARGAAPARGAGMGATPGSGAGAAGLPAGAGGAGSGFGARAGAATRSTGAPSGSFQIDFSAEPSHAELWLDGVNVGAGRLSRELPRDGLPHALRVVAAGYAPTTLLFMDAPPPRRVQLEKLSAAPRPSSDVAPSPAPKRPAQGARPRRPASAADPIEPIEPIEPPEPPREAGRPAVPRVQIIE